MKPVKDILCDDTGDIIIKRGDLYIDESDQQHIQDIIESAPGHWKQYPRLGANIIKMINGNIGNAYKRELFLHLEADNFLVEDIIISENNISVIASRGTEK